MSLQYPNLPPPPMRHLSAARSAAQGRVGITKFRGGHIAHGQNFSIVNWGSNTNPKAFHPLRNLSFVIAALFTLALTLGMLGLDGTPIYAMALGFFSYGLVLGVPITAIYGAVMANSGRSLQRRLFYDRPDPLLILLSADERGSAWDRRVYDALMPILFGTPMNAAAMPLQAQAVSTALAAGHHPMRESVLQAAVQTFSIPIGNTYLIDEAKRELTETAKLLSESQELEWQEQVYLTGGRALNGLDELNETLALENSARRDALSGLNGQGADNSAQLWGNAAPNELYQRPSTQDPPQLGSSQNS